jgi:hypothetical protein
MGDHKSPGYGLGSYPFFVGGILIFFVTNGYSRYVGHISLVSIFLFTCFWLLIAFGTFYILNRRLSSIHRAGLFTGYLLACYLFFGDIHAAFIDLPFLNRFRGVIILLTSVGVILYLYLRKARRSFAAVSTYLNVLFCFLIIFDIVQIIGLSKISLKKTNTIEPVIYSRVINKRPDLYLIILDEYAGNQTLKQHFDFDNRAFLRSLRDRSFFVAGNSISNYTYSPVSVASIFDMDYVSWANNERRDRMEQLGDAEKTIEESNLLKFLSKQGYKFHNFSVFDIGGNVAKYQPDLFPARLKLITSKTLGRQIKKHVQMSFKKYQGTKFTWIPEYFQETYRKGNNKLAELTLSTAREKNKAPKFVYLHLLMPHWPYLNDSSGPKHHFNAYREVSDDDTKAQYLGYLKNTNQYIIGVVDTIRKLTNNEAVIVIMSDHGYRYLNPNVSGSGNSNLNATYLPDKNYGQFYDSISNVNQFRVVLNSVFGTQLPLKTDSIVF